MSAEVAGTNATAESLDVRRHLELEGRSRDVYVRRALLVVLALIPALALAGFLGQRPSSSSAQNDAAALHVRSPTRVRGGLLFQTRIEVDTKRTLRSVALVLDRGWFEGMQVNSITPDPVATTGEGDRVVLALGAIPAGERSVTLLQFQVDPTNVGHRSQDVELREEGHTLLHIPRSITVLP